MTAARRRYSSPAVFGIASIIAAMVVGLIVYRLQSRPTVNRPAAIATSAPATRPASIAIIASEARQARFITWSFDTTIDAQTVSDKWYGDAVANVRAPVRYQYGVDLATLDDGAILRDAGTGQLTFIVAPPRRMSVEVDVERLEQSLRTSGIRWKSRNHAQLEETVRQLGAAANTLELSKRDEQRMRETSREQIERHLRSVLSRIEAGITVNVKFAE